MVFNEVIAKVFNNGIASPSLPSGLRLTRSQRQMAEERHCESAVADAAVSSYITHERNKFLRRSVVTTQSQ